MSVVRRRLLSLVVCQQFQQSSPLKPQARFNKSDTIAVQMVKFVVSFLYYLKCPFKVNENVDKTPIRSYIYKFFDIDINT